VEGERRLETRVPARLSPVEGRRFGLTVGGAFLVLGVLLTWRGRVAAAPVAFGLGAAFVVAGLILPARLGPVFRAWTALGAALSKVTTPIFLGVVYFGAIAPIGLVLRIFGRNPLTRHHEAASCWGARPADARSRRDMEHQF